MDSNGYEALSTRTYRAVKPMLPYHEAFRKAWARRWSASDSLGNIIATIAENKLSVDLLKERMDAMGSYPPDDVYMYPPCWTGTPGFRQAIVHAVQRTFLKGVNLDPDHIAVSAGAGAVIDTLFFCICSPGDGVLIPAPYYPAFDNDLQVKNQVKPLPVYLDLEGSLGPQLDAAAAAAAGQGHPVKAILLANPNNPMGTTYTREQVLGLLRWCLKNNVHLVSDEIYALSVFGEGAEHTSALRIALEEGPGLAGAEKLDFLLHTIWGFSKDFCASGLRVGVLHSKHPQLLSAYHNLGYFVTASSQVMWALEQVILDDVWMDAFIEENNQRLRRAYTVLSAGLKEAGVPFTPCDSAMFCFIDLRAALKGGTPTWEDERALWNKMVEEYRLLLTPGETCHAAAPGYFRVCYAWMPTEALPEAVRRMKLLLAGRPLEPDSAPKQLLPQLDSMLSSDSTVSVPCGAPPSAAGPV